MSIKSAIPFTSTLDEKIDTDWGSFTHEVKQKIGHLEADYKEQRRRRAIGASVLAGTFMVFQIGEFLPRLIPDAYTLLVTVIFILSLLGGGVYGGLMLYRSKGSSIRNFDKALNALIFPKVFSLLGVTGSHIEHTPLAQQSHSPKSFQLFTGTVSNMVQTRSVEAEQVLELLNHSELITQKKDQMIIDDMFALSVAGKQLFVSELLASRNAGGKKKKQEKLFKGYFVSLDLSKTFNGKTFVSTEGDKKGFGHKTFWSTLTNSTEVKESIFESNDFEKLLHVATSDETEARYILTPDLMAELYDWWRLKNENIRISFIANRMYLLFPDDEVRLYRTIAEISEPELKKHVRSIAHPLLHTLHVAESIGRRF